MLGGQNQVALVLAVVVIDDDDHSTLHKGGQGVLNPVRLHCASPSVMGVRLAEMLAPVS